MLTYLWTNRERSPLFSKAWFKTWAKRIQCLPSLISHEWQFSRLRLRGARLGEGTVVVKQSGVTGRAANVNIGRQPSPDGDLTPANRPVRVGPTVGFNDEVTYLTPVPA